MRHAWLMLLPILVLGGMALLRSPGLPLAEAQAQSSVRITAPADGATVSNPVTVSVTTSGATIKAATDGDPNADHLHYFIDRDPASVLQPGQPIPSGQPDIIHTADTSLPLANLSPGRHTVWVVLAHTDHTPLSPNVQAQVSFTVSGAAQAATAAPAGGGSQAGTASQPPQPPVTGTGGLLPGAQAPGANAVGPLLGLIGATSMALLLGGLALLRRRFSGERL